MKLKRAKQHRSAYETKYKFSENNMDKFLIRQKKKKIQFINTRNERGCDHRPSRYQQPYD